MLHENSYSKSPGTYVIDVTPARTLNQLKKKKRERERLGVRCFGTGVTEDCEPCRCWELNLGPLVEQQHFAPGTIPKKISSKKCLLSCL